MFAKYPPDLVVALHSGHAESEVQTWLPTLQCLLDLGVSAVFTTYNKQEAMDEEKIFDGMGAQFSKRLAENLWRGVLPSSRRSWSDTMCITLITTGTSSKAGRMNEALFRIVSTWGSGLPDGRWTRLMGSKAQIWLRIPTGDSTNL